MVVKFAQVQQFVLNVYLLFIYKIQVVLKIALMEHLEINKVYAKIVYKIAINVHPVLNVFHVKLDIICT